MSAGVGPGVAGVERRARPGLTIGLVRDESSAFYGVAVRDVLSIRRGARVLEARQVAIHLAHRLTRASLSMIGRCFGDRDHSTVRKAIQAVENRLCRDRIFASRVEELEAVILRAADQDDPARALAIARAVAAAPTLADTLSDEEIRILARAVLADARRAS